MKVVGDLHKHLEGPKEYTQAGVRFFVFNNRKYTRASLLNVLKTLWVDTWNHKLKNMNRESKACNPKRGFIFCCSHYCIYIWFITLVIKLLILFLTKWKSIKKMDKLQPHFSVHYCE